MKAIKIGIMPQPQIRARILAIARGELKPRPSDPTVWFTSMKSLAEVLSDDNRALLKVIRDTRPESVSSLAAAFRRAPASLSRKSDTTANYGILAPDRRRCSIVLASLAQTVEFDE